jgi:hypothetical protein
VARLGEPGLGRPASECGEDGRRRRDRVVAVDSCKWGVVSCHWLVVSEELPVVSCQ